MLGIISLGGICIDTLRLRKIIPESYFAVAADSGMAHFRMLGIQPDILAGDFDSIEPQLLEECIKENIKIIKVDKRKNFTDSELAVDTAVASGCDSLLFLGAFGNRLDHMLSNQMMAASLASKGINVILTDGKSFFFTVTSQNSPLCYPLSGLVSEEDIFSIIPISGEFVKVTIEGLDYPLEKEIIMFGSTRAVSNTVPKKAAKIESEKYNNASSTTNINTNFNLNTATTNSIGAITTTINTNSNEVITTTINTKGNNNDDFAKITVETGVVFFIHTKSDEFLK